MKKREYLKSRYFAVFSLKTDSPFKFTLKDMYNMSYIPTLYIRKNTYLMDSGMSHICHKWISKISLIWYAMLLKKMNSKEHFLNKWVLGQFLKWADIWYSYPKHSPPVAPVIGHHPCLYALKCNPLRSVQNS